LRCAYPAACSRQSKALAELADDSYWPIATDRILVADRRFRGITDMTGAAAGRRLGCSHRVRSRLGRYQGLDTCHPFLTQRANYSSGRAGPWRSDAIWILSVHPRRTPRSRRTRRRARHADWGRDNRALQADRAGSSLLKLVAKAGRACGACDIGRSLRVPVLGGSSQPAGPNL
jgi:hypothetical protein